MTTPVLLAAIFGPVLGTLIGIRVGDLLYRLDCWRRGVRPWWE